MLQHGQNLQVWHKLDWAIEESVWIQHFGSRVHSGFKDASGLHFYALRWTGVSGDGHGCPFG